MLNNDIKIEKQADSNLIYDSIRSMILNFELKPGDKINQLGMAKLLNTSRTPVVNVLHRLESEGLVDNFKNSGFFVHRLSIQELLDLFELREVIDMVILGNIAQSITDGEIKILENIFDDYHNNPKHVSEEEYRKLDMKFHTTLEELCQNRMLKRINDTMQIFARSYTAGLLRPLEDTIGEHNAILEALKKRDALAAENAGRLHVQKTRVVIKNTVNGLIQIGLDPANIHVDEIFRK